MGGLTREMEERWARRQDGWMEGRRSMDGREEEQERVRERDEELG